MRSVTDRVYPTSAAAHEAQEAHVGQPVDLTAAELIAEHTGVPSEDDSRRFSQAPPTDATVQALLGSVNVVEALGTVLDLAFLVDDVTEEEAASRNLIGAIVASAARIIKANL